MNEVQREILTKWLNLVLSQRNKERFPDGYPHDVLKSKFRAGFCGVPEDEVDDLISTVSVKTVKNVPCNYFQEKV